MIRSTANYIGPVAWSCCMWVVCGVSSPVPVAVVDLLVCAYYLRETSAFGCNDGARSDIVDGRVACKTIFLMIDEPQ